MSRFTFICEEEAMPFADTVSSKRTVEFNGESLCVVINEFEMFLRGCGFSFNGQLDFVDNHYGEEPPEWHTEEFETPQQKQFDFSEIQKINWPFPTQVNDDRSNS
jgi:hypothetical protein